MSSRRHHRHRRRHRRRSSPPSASSRSPAGRTCVAPAPSRARPSSATARPAKSDSRRRSSPRPTRTTVEAQGAIARYGTVARTGRGEGPRPVGAARRGGPRRQPPAVPQPGVGHAHERRPRRASSPPGSSPSSGRRRRAASVKQVTVGKLDDILETHPHRRRLLLRPRRPHLDHRVPARRLAGRRDRSTTPNIVSGMEQGIVALYQKCPHLGCRVPSLRDEPDGSSARATARSTTASVRRRPARRRVAWTASRVTVAGNGDVTVDTGTIVAGPPIGTNTTGQEAEGPHCITGGGRALIDRPRYDDHRLDPHGGGGRRVDRLRGDERRLGEKEAGSEIELAPNRKPYYDDEVLEGRRLERVQLYGVLLLVVVVIGLPLYWVFEPDRQAGAQEGIEGRFVTWGSQLFAPTADAGFNCAGCHGGMNATGGQAAYTVTDGITGEVRAVDWLAPALNTVLLPLRRGRGPLHPHLRAAGLADVGVGAGRRRPDERPADRHADRLPPVDPDPTRGLLRGGGRRPAVRERPPAGRGPGRHRDAGPPIGRGRHLRQLRRGAVQPRAVQRRLQLRPLPHQGLELRRLRASPGRVPSGGT